MKLLVVELIGVVLCLHSVPPQVSGTIIELGPVNVTASFGSIPEKYNMTKKDIDASNNGISQMEYLRRFIYTGLDRVPILDPYTKDALIPVNFNYPNMSGTLNLFNLEATGAESFTLRNLEIRLENSRLDFKIEVPEVKIEVDFNTTDLIYNGVEEDVDGHLNINFYGYVATGAIFGLQNLYDDSIYVVGLNVTNDIDNLVADLTENEGLQAIPADVINDAIQQMAKSVLLTAVNEINHVLQALTYSQLLGFLNVQS